MDKVKLQILEQNAVLNGFIKQALSNDPAEIFTSQTATLSQALSGQSQLTPDIIIMDIRQPEMCGLDAIPLLLRQSPKAKIILLTDEDDSRYQKAAKSNGVYACLRKDLIATKLAKLVEEVWGINLSWLRVQRVKRRDVTLTKERV